MSSPSPLALEESSAARWWATSGPRVSMVLFGLAILGIIGNFASSLSDHREIAVQNRVVLDLEQLLSAARDMETGSRGYVLVGSDDYLAPYRASLAAEADLERTARVAWTDSGGQADDLATLFTLLGVKREYTINLVDARRTLGFSQAQAMIASGKGREVMEAIRAGIAHLQEQAADRRRAIERHARVQSLILTLFSMVTALAACALLGWVAWYRRQAAQRVSLELAGLGDQFRTLADNIPQLCWMADAAGHIYWYNQRWYDYTGLQPADMAGDGWRKAQDPDLVDDVASRYFQAIVEGKPWSDTFPLRDGTGAYHWFLSLAQPIRNANGDILRWFGSHTDITAQRQQEQELAAARDLAEEANQAKSQFLANMSHELRTPLSAVIGYSEMLEEEVQEMGQAHLLDDLAKIKFNARHLLSLINDVLDISKIEANKMEVFAETFDIAQVVNDVAATVGSLIDKKHNRLDIDLADDLGSMQSDVVKIRQMLINLLSNAAKFTEGGDIVLAVRRSAGIDGDLIIFAVRDTGVGMTEEQVARLFQRFTQADVSTTRRFGGTGLGLALTKAFAGMLGGEVSVRSRAGEGSSFEVTIPAVLPAPPAEDLHKPEVPAGDDDNLVLVIDDDPATRDLLSRFLTREGFSVRLAADGRAGLDMAEALRPHVIVLDVTMPRMDGWSVLRSLKEHPDLGAIPVIMCTVIDEQNLGFSLGASDYILKPVNWERLREGLARVQHHLAKGEVLVVDDDADTRTRLKGLLTKNGFGVTEAENGRAALEAVRRQVPSLVLLDLNMPEMDGFTFLHELRSTPDWTSVPVIVMTARDLTAAERADLKGGGARVFQKGQAKTRDLIEQLRTLAAPLQAASAPTTAEMDRVDGH